MRISIRKPHKLTSKWHKSRIICNFFARKFVNSLKISKLSILESEKETAIEKAGVKVVTNYENLIENYQPALNELVQAATEIDTILFKYAEAQQRFNKVKKISLRVHRTDIWSCLEPVRVFKCPHFYINLQALKGVVKACNSSVGNDDEAVDSIKEAEKLHKQISAEWKDFSEVYAADMIKPFDEKMTQGECLF